jgi:hypothetical protein
VIDALLQVSSETFVSSAITSRRFQDIDRCVAALHQADLVHGLSYGNWSSGLSGYFEDQAYALDIMMSNLQKGQPAQTW